MERREKSGFEKLVEHEHRLTINEYQLQRVMKAVDSEDDSGTVLEKKLIKLEATVKYNTKIIYMLLGTIIMGVATWILRSFI